METPTHPITLGLDSDLDEAARIATSEMVRFLVEKKGLSREDAYILASVGVDLRVTQIVEIFLFYPDITRAMDYRPARTNSIRDGRPAGIPSEVGIARIITHDILHYFLPRRLQRYLHGAPAR